MNIIAFYKYNFVSNPNKTRLDYSIHFIRINFPLMRSSWKKTLKSSENLQFYSIFGAFSCKICSLFWTKLKQSFTPRTVTLHFTLLSPCQQSLTEIIVFCSVQILKKCCPDVPLFSPRIYFQKDVRCGGFNIRDRLTFW